MSFNDTHKVYSRLEAMKVAKEQANMRERAAEYIKDGREARLFFLLRLGCGICGPVSLYKV